MMKTLFKPVILIFTFVISPGFSAIRAETRLYNIYIGDAKIGFSREQTFNQGDKKIKKFYNEMNLKVMGQKKKIIVKGKAIRKGGMFEKALVEIKSDLNLKLISKYDKGEIVINKITPYGKDTINIKVENPHSVYTPYFFDEVYADMIKKGEKTRKVNIFDPSMGQLLQAIVYGKGKGEINRGEKSIKGILFKVDSDVISTTVLTEKSGKVIYEKDESGIETILATKEKLKRGNTNSDISIDIIKNFSIPLEGNLDPGEVKKVTYEIKGINLDSFKLTGLRQEKKGKLLRLIIEDVPFSGYKIPYKGKDMQPFLGKDFLINPEQPEIQRIAWKIVDNERDSVRATKKIIDWVYRNLEKEPVISVPDPVGVLQTRKGDCNEHAVLAVSLLRAVGIPSRVAVGVVLSGSRFYYHAWVEAFVGKWISADPTTDQIPADLSHIRFASGSLEHWVNVMKLVGKVRIRLVDAK